MGIANAFSRVIRQQLKQHAAWMPITNTFALGDFGVVSQGVFTRMGNVGDLGVTWKQRSGAASGLDFSSDSVSSTRIEGGAEVEGFSKDGSADAKLVLGFDRQTSFVIKAAELISHEIEDVFAVADALARSSRWRPSYRFVTRVYEAQNPLILGNRAASTQVTLTGKAAALEQLERGKFSADLGVSADRELALEITGESGILALGLGRVTLADKLGARRAGVEEDTNWDEDPKDDV